jgi:hypothetical protein
MVSATEYLLETVTSPLSANALVIAANKNAKDASRVLISKSPS